MYMAKLCNWLVCKTERKVERLAVLHHCSDKDVWSKVTSLEDFMLHNFYCLLNFSQVIWVKTGKMGVICSTDTGKGGVYKTLVWKDCSWLWHMGDNGWVGLSPVKGCGGTGLFRCVIFLEVVSVHLPHFDVCFCDDRIPGNRLQWIVSTGHIWWGLCSEM